MKIIFLDIDGVLNTEFSQLKARGFKGIDHDKVLLLKDITAKTGAKIVLSSSWRSSDYGKNLIRAHLDFFDVTPPIDGIRGYQIQNWLFHNPTVTKYAILDDDTDMLPQQSPCFFNTSFEQGLTREIADKVIQHLL